MKSNPALSNQSRKRISTESTTNNDGIVDNSGVSKSKEARTSFQNKLDTNNNFEGSWNLFLKNVFYSNPKLFIEAETPFQQQNHRDSHGCSKLIDKRCINSYGNLTLLI